MWLRRQMFQRENPRMAMKERAFKQNKNESESDSFKRETR